MVKDNFNQLIKETVKPLLSSNGFSKKSLNFYKQEGAIIYFFNIQKSHGNSFDRIKFYINCGIHSVEIDHVLGRAQQLNFNDHQAYFVARISSLTNSETDGYVITKDTDLDALKINLITDIDQVLSKFRKIESTHDLTDLMISENGLHHYEDLFEYLLLTNDYTRLNHFVKQLHDKFGAETRWRIFENTMSKILEKHDSNIVMRELLQ